MTVSGIIDILKACHQSEVRTLSYRGLQITFSGGRPEEVSLSPIKLRKAVAAAETTEKQALDEQEIRIKDTQLAELLVTDPLEYEKLLAAGDLEDVSTDSGQSEYTDPNE